MVIFDQNIMMPTLGINANTLLNQAPGSFCMDCKTTSKWSLWCWPILQKHSQMLIIKMQSGNLQAEIRSNSQNGISQTNCFWQTKNTQRCLVIWAPHPIFSLAKFNQKILAAISSNRWWAESIQVQICFCIYVLLLPLQYLAAYKVALCPLISV